MNDHFQEVGEGLVALASTALAVLVLIAFVKLCIWIVVTL